jgi:hypothetical protein
MATKKGTRTEAEAKQRAAEQASNVVSFPSYRELGAKVVAFGGREFPSFNEMVVGISEEERSRLLTWMRRGLECQEAYASYEGGAA